MQDWRTERRRRCGVDQAKTDRAWEAEEVEGAERGATMGVAGSRGRCRTSRSTDSRAGTRHGGYGRFCAVYATVALQAMKGLRASAKGSEPHCAEMCKARCDDGEEDGDGARKSRAQGATPNGRGRTKGRKGAGKMMERTAVGGEGARHIWKGETHRNEP